MRCTTVHFHIMSLDALVLEVAVFKKIFLWFKCTELSNFKLSNFTQ